MKKSLKAILIIVPSVLLVAAVVVCLFLPAIHYHLALQQREAGDYTKAYKNLMRCGGYKDSQVLLEDFTIQYETLWTEATYHKDGLNAKHPNRYTYDAKGNVTLAQVYKANGELLEEIRGEFQYDAEGRLILETYQDKNGHIERYEYGYGASKYLTSRVWIDRDFQHKHYYTYDAAGNLTQVERYDLDGRLLNISKRTYDEMGSIVRQDYYSGKTLLSTTLWEYEYAQDPAGRQTMVAQYDAKGNLDHREEYTYDRDGNKIKETYYTADGTPDYTTSWEYDSRGNLRKETQINGEGWVKEETTWSRDHSVKTQTRYEYGPDGTLTETLTRTYTDLVAFYDP